MAIGYNLVYLLWGGFILSVCHSSHGKKYLWKYCIYFVGSSAAPSYEMFPLTAKCPTSHMLWKLYSEEHNDSLLIVPFPFFQFVHVI